MFLIFVDGEVYGCETGATGRGCRKVTTTNTPDSSVKEYCAKNPNSSLVPMVANNTASYWRCKGKTPAIDRSTRPDQVDKHGYIEGAWKKMLPQRRR
jgi:hypothetical protein